MLMATLGLTPQSSNSRQTPIILQLAPPDAYRLPLSCTSATPVFLCGKRKARGLGGKTEERKMVV